MRELFQCLRARMDAGQDTVMATVIASSGEVPRGPGARMLVGENGRIWGTVGGGTVEYRSEQIGMEVLRTGTSQQKNFCLNPNNAENPGMVCGGGVDIWFVRIRAGDRALREVLEQMEACWQTGESFWLVCDPDRDLISGYGTLRGAFGAGLPQALTAKLAGKAQVIPCGESRWFCQQLLAAGKVYIFGGGYVARALVPLLERLRFRCVVVEDRAEVLAPGAFPPGTELVCLPLDGMGELMAGIGADDMICVMTRGHQNDYEVQIRALQTPAKYIGVIGSRSKHRYAREKALAAGYSEQALARITAPIGLDISSDSPEEIAVSIAAQLIMVRANRPRADWSK